MKQKKRFKMTSFLFVVLGAIVTVVSGYINYKEKIISSEEAKANQKKFEDSQNQLIELNKLHKEEIHKTNTELLSAKDSIVGLQNELLGLQTGSKDYPYIFPYASNVAEPQEIGLIIRNNDDKTIYDIYIYYFDNFLVHDISDSIDKGKFPAISFADTRKEISIPFLLSHDFKTILQQKITTTFHTMERDYIIQTKFGGVTRLQVSYNMDINNLVNITDYKMFDVNQKILYSMKHTK